MLITQVGEETEQLVAEDGVVIVLVIEFENFNKVMDSTGVLGFFGLLEDWVKVIDNHDLLALLLLSAKFVNRGQGWVQVARPQQVPNIESVDFAITLEVIDVKSKPDF